METGGRAVSPYLFLALGLFTMAWSATLVKLAEAPPLIIATYRMALATVSLLPFAPSFYGREIRALGGPGLGWIILSGLSLGAHFATWIASLEYTSVASSVVLVNLNPLFVALFAHFALRERVSRSLSLGIGLALAGGILIGAEDWSASDQALWGDLLALAGSVAMSGYLLAGRKVRPRLSLIPYIFLIYAMAAGMLALLASLVGDSFHPYPRQTYLIFVLLALGPTLVGHTSINYALRYLATTIIAVIILGETIGSTLVAYLLLDEVPGPIKLFGAGLILAAIYITTTRARQARISDQRL